MKQHVAEQPKGQRRNQISWDNWKWKYNILELKGCSKSSSNKAIYSDKCLHQEKRKFSNKQPNLYPKELEKEQI